MRGWPPRRAHILLSAVLLLLATATGGRAQLAREASPPLPSDATAALLRAPLLPTESSFALEQLRHDRVLDARVETRFNIKRLFHEKGIRYPADEIFLRIFKRERSLELWVRAEGEDAYALLKTYAICALAGELGPKRRQGDSQTPEGFYFIDFFNPRSDYHLSLHLDYPNRRDRILGVEGTNLGGDIFIHGGCNSEGCLALTDEGIKELYWVAVEARAVGQQRIPVHIFPARLEDRDFEQLQRVFGAERGLVDFWSSLRPGYDFFEKTRRVPAMSVDAQGNYRVDGAAARRPLGESMGTPEPAAATPGKPAPKRPLGTPVVGGGG